MSRSLVSFILLFIAAITILSSCSDSGANSEIQDTDPTNLIGPEGGTVVSDDELVELIIPENALSDETEITITKYNSYEPDEILGVPVDVAYDLSPDGLTFNNPVEIRYSEFISNEDDTLGVVFGVTRSESGIEPLNNSSLSYSEDDNKYIFTGEISHFSDMIYQKKFFDIVFIPPEKLCIGETGVMKIEIINKFQVTPIIHTVTYLNNMNEDVITEFSENLTGKDKITLNAPVNCRSSEPGMMSYFFEMGFKFKVVGSSEEYDMTIAPSQNFFNKLKTECIDCSPEAPSEAPSLISPEDNSEGVERTPTLQWEQVENAGWYEVQWVREGESFDDENVNRALTKDQQWTLDKLDEETEYQWRVRAWNGPEFDEEKSESGEWSDEWSFITGKSTETLELGDLTVCVEHGDSKSDIFFEWAIISNFFDNLSDIKVKMVVTLPDGTTADITTSPLSAQILLFTLEIYTYGNYQYEITEVTYKEDPIDISGENLTGEVDVTAEEQNRGECGD